MEPLTKPANGYSFAVWRFLFHFNIARSGLWAIEVRGVRRTVIVDVSLAERTTGYRAKALSITFLPFKIMIGFIAR